MVVVRLIDFFLVRHELRGHYHSGGPSIYLVSIPVIPGRMGLGVLGGLEKKPEREK